MLEMLNNFFKATYIHNHSSFGVQLLCVMSLMGIGLGLTNKLLFTGWQGVCRKLQIKKP